MRIACPYCGDRDHAEFTYRGDAAPVRPPLRAKPEAQPPGQTMIDYVYIRENPAGLLRELWQHTGGCRAWVVVERDVTTHAVWHAAPARAVPVGEGVR